MLHVMFNDGEVVELEGDIDVMLDSSTGQLHVLTPDDEPSRLVMNWNHVAYYVILPEEEEDAE